MTSFGFIRHSSCKNYKYYDSTKNLIRILTGSLYICEFMLYLKYCYTNLVYPNSLLKISSDEVATTRCVRCNIDSEVSNLIKTFA